MASADNKQLVVRFFDEAWNKGNLDYLDEIYDPDFVLHALWYNAALGGRMDARGIEPAKSTIAGWREGWPDIHVTVEDQVAEGDRVGSRHEALGTHERAFMGIEPTGKRATISGMTITRVTDGRVTEAWTCWDALGVMRQLGLAPPPSAQPAETPEEHRQRAERAASHHDPDPSSVRNKEVLHRFWQEAWNEGNLDVIDEIFHEDFVDHGLAPGLTQTGVAGAREAVQQFRTPVPDLYLDVHDMLAEGDKVLTRWTAGGTQAGPLAGIPPTGRRAELTGITINRVVDGRIVEAWDTFDMFGLMVQLGVIGGPGGAGGPGGPGGAGSPGAGPAAGGPSTAG